MSTETFETENSVPVEETSTFLAAALSPPVASTYLNHANKKQSQAQTTSTEGHTVLVKAHNHRSNQTTNVQQTHARVSYRKNPILYDHDEVDCSISPIAQVLQTETTKQKAVPLLLHSSCSFDSMYVK